MLRTTLCLGLSINVLLGAAPIDAQAQDTRSKNTSTYAHNLGDGLRLYTESKYTRAVKYLFRAYAEKPRPSTLGFIIRSYDLMGSCSAVQTQMVLYHQSHPQSKKPTLQRCTAPATLTITCSSALANLVITPHITMQCGHTTQLPGGTYTVQSSDGRVSKRITLSANQVKTIKVEPTPKKWSRAVAKNTTKRRINLKRIEDPKRYTMTLSADGLYEIWIPKKNGPPVCGKKSDGERVCGMPSRTIVIPRLD